jgi:hypothetical protein
MPPYDFDAPGTPDLDETPGAPSLSRADTADADPDLAVLGDVGQDDSDLASIEAELAAAVTPTTIIKVEGRPGWSVRYRTDFTGKDLDGLRKNAKDRRFADGVDGIKFAALLLALTCQGIRRHGQDLELDGASPVTFTSPELQSLLGTRDANSTVRKLYGLEGHVDAAARKLMAEAGWGDEADLADPTD